MKLVRLLLNLGVDRELITRNVAARVPAPRIQTASRRILTPVELGSVVNQLPERWRAFVLVGAYGSLRWSELVGVRRSAIDMAARTVRIDQAIVEVRGRFVTGPPKTEGAARTVDLPMVAVKPLAEHLLGHPVVDTDGLVFRAEGGNPVRRHVFRPIWQRACTAAGISEPVHLEWLRHTGASIAYAATSDLKATAARLGHTNTRMVDQVYVELYAETSKAVADAIDELVARASRGLSADS